MEWNPLYTGSPTSRFFISYRRPDAALAEALRGQLVHAGHSVWRDTNDIYVGDQWREEIERAIARSDDIVVLLTLNVLNTAHRPPENPNQVLLEIQSARSRNKRILCFATTDPRQFPAFYEPLKDTNYIQLPDEVTESLATSPARAARHIAQQILEPHTPQHPASLRDFERVATRRIFPAFSDIEIERSGQLRDDLLTTYLTHAQQLIADEARSNAVLCCNAALLACHRQHHRTAIDLFQQSLRNDDSALQKYFFACALAQQIRPFHMNASERDKAIALAKEAWLQQRSPLVALALIALLWDSDSGRDSKAQRAFVDALENLPKVETDMSEVRRLMWFFPFNKMDLPVDGLQLERYFQAITTR